MASQTCIAQIRELLKQRKWWSLSELTKVTGFPATTVSARIRDLRKPEYGGWNIARRLSRGRPEYRFDENPDMFPAKRHRCQTCGGKGYKTGGRVVVVRDEKALKLAFKIVEDYDSGRDIKRAVEAFKRCTSPAAFKRRLVATVPSVREE